MSHSPTLRHMAPAVALLLVAASLVPPGAGQASCEPDCLRIESLSMEQAPVVAQGDNKITGYIMNDGSTPRQVRAFIQAEADGLQAESSRALYTIPGGAQAAVPMNWDGPARDAGVDEVEFTLVAWAEAGGEEVPNTRQTMSITRAVQYNDFALELDSEATEPLHRGDTATVAELNLTNTGNVRDEAIMAYTAEASENCDGQSPLDWGIDIFLDPEIDAGESTPVVVQATAPANDWVGCSLDITLSVSSSEMRVNDPLRDEQQITTPTVTDGTGIRVSLDRTSHEDVPLGASRSYTATVYNPTENAENVQVAAALTLGESQGVAVGVTPSGSVQVMPGESVDFQVSVQVAPDALAGTRMWTVTTSDPGAPGDEPHGTHLIGLGVAPVFGVGAFIDPDYVPPATSDPGQTIQVPVRLSNLGNSIDTLCIVPELPDDWSQGAPCAELDPAPTGNAEEPLNRTLLFDWELTPDTWASDGEQTVTFQVASGHEGTVSNERSLQLSLAQRTYPRLVPALPPVLPSLQAEPCVFAARPGEQFTFNLALRNEGNLAGDFGLSKQDVDPDWTVSAPTNEEYALDRLESHTAQIVVQAPEAFEPGESSSFGFRFEDIDDPSRFHALECTVHASFPDLLVAQADPPTTPLDLYAGHPATLRFRVSNEGWNATGVPVLVQSVIHGPDGKEFQKQNHTLPALDRWTGESSRELDVKFTPSKPGMYTYEVTIDPDNTIAEPDDDDNVVTGEVQVFDFGIEVDAPPGREAIPTQHLTFEGTIGDNPAFKIVNNGDRTHSLNLSLAMDPPWRPLSYQNVTLEPGAEHWVDINFTIPATPLTGEVQVTLTAANATLPTLASADTTRIRIHDTGAPTISNFTADATAVLAGGNVSFEADLHDTTGIAEARLIVVDPSGEPGSQAMTANASVGTFRGNLTFDALGVHTVYVWSMDQAGNVADNSDNGTLEVRVLPADRPHVQLIAPENGTHIQPGTPIVLSVLSRLPVDQLAYTTAPEAAPTHLPATNPVQLPTDDWPDGEVNLSVTVVDSLGAEGASNFSFLVDGTPPKILAIAIDPEGAPPGTDVDLTATVQDASPLRSVVLRIERTDGRAQDLDLDADGAEKWSARVELPEDAVGLAVVAIDAAGNRAYAERSLADPQLLDGEPGSRFTPALPVIVVLAALIGVRNRRVEDE